MGSLICAFFARRDINEHEELQFDYGPDTEKTMHWRMVRMHVLLICF